MLRSNRMHVNRMRILSIMLTITFCMVALPSSAQSGVAADHPLIVGYFRGDSMRRQFFVKDLISRDAAPILDQINYSQANIADNRCIVADPAADLGYSFSAENSVDGTADTPAMPLRGNFHQLQELKHLYPHIKVLISLEGNADVFVKAAQPENRSAFVGSCIQQFIQGKIADGVEAPGLFDGIDIDWEYPEEADKLNFIALLGEFRRQLNTIGPTFIVSVAMGTARSTYQHLDMAAVALYADQIAIMNYDYAGPWSKRTGLVAPLYCAPGDPEIDGDVDSTIGSYKKAGVPVSRMLMGLPSTPIPGIKLRRTIMDCFNSANRIARMFCITTLFPFKTSSLYIAIQNQWRRGCSTELHSGLMTMIYPLAPKLNMQKNGVCGE